MTHIGAEGAPHGRHRRRSIFRDDSPDAELPDPWALAAEPGSGPDSSGDPGVDREDRPVELPRRSIFRSESGQHEGTAR